MEKLSICRICLNVNVQHVIEDSQLQEIYERLTKIPFQTSDRRPLALCYICLGKLKACQRLMIKCLKAEEQLTEMLDELLNNEDKDLNRITTRLSALDQWSVHINDPTRIESTVQDDEREIPSHFEINVKLEEQSMQDLLDTVCTIEPAPDDVQGMPDPGDDTTFHNIMNNIETARDEDETIVKDNMLYGLNPATPIGMKPYLEFEVKNSTNMIEYVNTDTDHIAPEETKSKYNCNVKPRYLGDMIQIKTENNTIILNSTSATNDQSNLSSDNIGQNYSVKDKNTKICLHSESENTFCDTCKKTFATRYDLMVHIQKHPAVMSHVCDLCSKSYKEIGLTVRADTLEKPFGCNRCGKQFAQASLLKSHAIMHTRVKAYLCSVCKKRFPNKSLLKSHANTHISGKGYPCNVCTQRFPNKSLLTSHAMTHKTGKVYSCKLCKKRFNQMSLLQAHSSIHVEIIPFVCQVCNMKFFRQEDLDKHSFIHTGGKRYVCSVCKKGFYQMCHLRVHARVHTGEKPYSCGVCKKFFSQKSYLKIHSRIHARDKTYVRKKRVNRTSDMSVINSGENVYVCDICGKSFNHKGVFKRHVRFIHIGDRPYVCQICKKSFRLRCELSYHTRFHTGEKPFQCDVCNKSFHQKSTLTRHALIHTGEKPYVCNFCDKGFNQKAILDGHVRTHTGEKPHICDICDKRFRSRSDMTKHKLLHTDDRRHVCDVCGRRFHRKTTLKRHARVHTAERAFACSICNERFRHSSTLKSHMQTHGDL